MDKNPWRDRIEYALAPLPESPERTEVERGLEADLEHASKIGQFLAVVKAAATDLGLELHDQADVVIVDAIATPFPHEYDEPLGDITRRIGRDITDITKDRAVELMDQAIHTEKPELRATS